MTHAEPEEHTGLHADCEMLLVWRENRSFHPATPLSERRCDFGHHDVPQFGGVRSSLDAVEQVDERLELGVDVRGGKFEVDVQTGQFADAEILRMEFPAAPKAWLCLDGGTKLPGS